MLDQILNEIEELRSYKQKYDYQKNNMQVMSDMIYDFMIREYEQESYEEHCSKQVETQCKCCRHYGCILMNSFPDDIHMPIRSDVAWIPGRKGCKDFDWD